MSKINKHSDWGWGTDAYPAQEPQELQFQKDREDSSRIPRQVNEDFVWVVSGKNIAVVHPDSVEEAFVSLGIRKDHHGPFAFGKVQISRRWLVSFVVDQSNIDLESLHGVFLKWAKDPSIDFEDVDHPFHIDMVKDKNGIPIPVKILKTAADPGVGDGNYPDKLWVNTDDGDIRTDIQRKYPGQGDLKAYIDPLTSFPYQCVECLEVFKTYDEMREHMSFDHKKEDLAGPEYEIRDNDEFFYPDNEASRPGGDLGIHTGSVLGPVPFSYDVYSERVFIKDPGEEISRDDNNTNKAEGYYTPDGDLLIVGHPSEPYAISSLINAWNQFYPEHKIKHIYLLRKENGVKIREKVANA